MELFLLFVVIIAVLSISSNAMKTSIVKQRNSALSYNHKTIKAVNRLMNNPLQIIPKRYLLSMLQMSSNDPENETTTIEQGSGADKILNKIIETIAKVPLITLREIVNGLPAVSATGAKVPRISTKESLKGEDNMEKIWNTALAAFWTISGGDWEAYDKIVNEKLSDSAEQNTVWMRDSLMAGTEIPESRLKELIKKYGAGNFSVPKRIVDTKKNNDDPVLNLKMDYVTSLVSILASQFANDYREVALFVQKEAKKATNAKGFGSK